MMKEVHLSDLETGMTVLINGEMRTVNRSKHVKRGFTGWCFDGDPFYQSKGFVTQVLIPRWYQGKIIYYV